MIETVIRDRRSSLVGEKNMSHFPFRGSPNIQNTVSSAPSSPPVSVAMAVTSTVPPGARSSSPCSGASGPQNTRCCDTGRPIFTDQATGQTICSCQYDLINYRLANAGITPSGIPLSMYSMPYAESIPGYFPGVGGDQPPFYPNPGPGLDLKENLAAGGVHWPYPHVYAAYDATFGGYPFNGYGLDVNGARRKNATRETTSTLKAWLNEHKKNPYPTKGEKIMLAIITKMTLTQVSTWFANARRRLKKENKMTWEPRNRVDDDDANVDDDDHKSTDGKDLIIDSKDSCTGSSEDGDRSSNRLDMLDQPSGMDMKSDWSESRPNSGPNSPDICDRTRSLHHPLIHPSALHHLRPLTGSPPDPKHTPGGSTINSNVINKPRIWSLADMASKENTSDSQPSQSGIYSPAPGKIISPLSGRYPIHPSPYVKPEFYRSFYSPSPAHLPGGHTDVSLLESYQLTFGASLAHNRLAAMNPLTSMKTKLPGNLPHPLTPLNLPLNSTTPPSGVSPSASSTSSGPEITTVPSVGKSSPPINVTRP